MEEFHREVNLTSIGVKTLSNNFEAVSDSQFVENRVHDEEDDMIYEVSNILSMVWSFIYYNVYLILIS